jgi:hypothetical protein
MILDPTHFPFLEVAILFNTCVFALHTYLDFRQRRVSGQASSCQKLQNAPMRDASAQHCEGHDITTLLTMYMVPQLHV